MEPRVRIRDVRMVPASNGFIVKYCEDVFTGMSPYEEPSYNPREVVFDAKEFKKACEFFLEKSQQSGDYVGPMK